MMNDFSEAATDGVVTLNGIAFPMIHKATKCKNVPSPFQEIRQGIRSAITP